jgi:PAS domain S-box-containing protein
MVMKPNERKQSDQKLHERPDLLASILGSAMDAIIAIDDAERIVVFNAAAQRMFGCPADEAIGNSIERFIPERFRAGHSTHVRRFGESGVTNRTLHGLGTLWGLRATGEEFPIEAFISKVESSGKRYFTAVIRDITERKRSDETLRESEERFRLAAKAGRMFAYEWDAATDLITRSPESAEILGINEAVPITGQQVLAKVHPEDREKLKDAVAALSSEKPYLHVSYRMIRPDNTVIWLERSSCAHFDEQGKLLRIVGMVADITERTLAAEVLKKSEEKFATAFKCSPQPFTLSTLKEDRYLEVNNAFVLKTGWSREEAIGHTTVELRIWENHAEREKLVERILRGEPISNIECRFRKKNGEIFAGLLSAELIELGGEMCVVANAIDTTELRAAEDRLREYEKAVEGLEEMIVVVDREYRYLIANRKFLNLRNMTREQVEGHFANEVMNKGVLRLSSRKNWTSVSKAMSSGSK